MQEGHHSLPLAETQQRFALIACLVSFAEIKLSVCMPKRVPLAGHGNQASMESHNLHACMLYMMSGADTAVS